MTAECLRHLNLKDEYRSDEDRILDRLFLPCLSIANTYDRAVGFFTSSGLAAASRGLESFVSRSGSMRLIASPLLRGEDIEAIEEGLQAREDIVEIALLRQLAVEADSDVVRRLSLLSWLLAEDRLEIRLALRDGSMPGIYHEKIGIFGDADGHFVAVAGSANETQGGLIDNFEAVDVFTSWGDTANRVDRKRGNFQRLWEGKTRGLRIVSFPEAVRDRLLELAPPPKVPRTGPQESSQPIRVPERLVLRTYQAEAVAAWAAKGYSGILEMATGTGKTVTSLEGLRHLRDSSSEPLAIVVLAPLIHLVNQWASELRKWGLRPYLCYGSRNEWLGRVQEAIDFFRAGAVRNLSLVATHATSSLPAFRSAVAQLPGHQILVLADEVHHLGTNERIAALPEHARFRLGLSATPERWEDPEGTRRIVDYFGEIVFKFGLAEAIDAHVLCPYTYHPIIVRLEPEELQEYWQVTERIVRQLQLPQSRRDDSLLRSLLVKRAVLLDTASGKLVEVRKFAEANQVAHCLFYCANRVQLSAVMDMLWDRGIGARQFTGEESARIRAQVLEDLGRGAVPALVAIKCLDEGVDVPQAREALLLASSANPMEFTQRRGRLLRKWPGKDRARIHDLIVLPDVRSETELDIVRREFRRVAQFASVAANRSGALEILWPFVKRYDLIHELGG